jgi:hypothetical protein
MKPWRCRQLTPRGVMQQASCRRIQASALQLDSPRPLPTVEWDPNDVNLVVVTGNLGQDPEAPKMDRAVVANMSLAVSRGKDRPPVW